MTALLAGCGGGGSGSSGVSQTNTPSPAVTQTSATTPTPTPTPTPPLTLVPTPTPAPTPPPSQSGSLLISEISTSINSNDVAWVEIYNPNNSAADLSLFTLRAPSVKRAGGSFSINQTADFALPAVSVPAKGFFVIGGKASDTLVANSQIAYVSNIVSSVTTVPHWSSGGSIELLKGGATVDFVRFGSSSVSPASAGQWIGSNVSALPTGSTDHAKSIVRLASGRMMDTNTAPDWTLVNFATPGGINDIAAGIIDSDVDGVPDSAKIQGNTYAGMDLYAMGARPGQRDLFIQVDWMPSFDPATTPRKEALQKLVALFAGKNLAPQKNIVVHPDAGSLYAASFDPANFNLGGGKATAWAKCVDLDETSTRAGCVNLSTIKSANFDVRRTLLFHYALFGSSQNSDGSCGNGGVGWLDSSDVLVTLAECGYSTFPGSEFNQLINAQFATLLHELGHNLGLRHGGFEDSNYKPNYNSVMNYLYSYAGLSADPSGINAAQRYYLSNDMKGLDICSIDNSPCGNSAIFSFSDGTGQSLDENNLLESENIGYGSAGGAYADWNDNNAKEATRYSQNLHSQDTSYGLSVLKDYNDWQNLTLPFARARSDQTVFGNASPIRTPPAARKNPMNGLRGKAIVEQLVPRFIRATHGRHGR